MVGLYMAPPEDAIVICVDEKPSIEALERAPGLPQAAQWTDAVGHSHDQKQHGTPTLFATLDLATGKVSAVHKNVGDGSSSSTS